MGAISGESGETFAKGFVVTRPDLDLRRCLRDPIPEIFEAAFYLDEAVVAHLTGQKDLVNELLHRTNCQVIRDWTESLWGKNSPYVKYRAVTEVPAVIPEEQRIEVRMPTRTQELELQKRDGFHCRFCSIPVIRKEVREHLHALYPEALPWGTSNEQQHAAFQAMWLQYDHIRPHSRGGSNEADNIVITCAPCNYGRGSHMPEEVGLLDPRKCQPVRSSWHGLEQIFRPKGLEAHRY
jgi:5-methylcytosine-specific restriction endonuclease McrA